MRTDELRRRLAATKSKGVDPYRDLAVDLEPNARTIEQLSRLLDDERAPVLVGASWVLKSLIDEGAPVPDAARATLIGSIAGTLPSDAVLHLLQILPHLDPSAAEQRGLAKTLDVLLETTDHKFVRAWAFNGLALLAVLDPQRADRTRKRLIAAMDGEAASVRARIRHALKGL